MLRRLERALGGAARCARIVDPAFRLLTSLIFIIGGLGHFVRAEEMVARIAQSPWRRAVEAIGDPLWLPWISGAVFVVAGVTLTLGWLTRLSALALFVTLVPITITIHIAPGHTGPLFKNIAILGGLAFIFVRGPGACALDKRRRI